MLNFRDLLWRLALIKEPPSLKGRRMNKSLTFPANSSAKMLKMW